MRHRDGFIKSRASRRRGVRLRASSLIELLVVISVIALLMAMLVPSLKRSISLARETVCMHNLKDLYHSLAMYRVENNGWLPSVVPTSFGATASAAAESEVWFQKLFPTYLSDPVVLSCPADPYKFRMEAVRDRLGDPAAADFASFGINSFIVTAGKGRLANVDRYEASRPGSTILVADIGPDRAVQSPTPGREGPTRNGGLLSFNDFYNIYEGTSQSWVTTRHGDGINMLTLSGGVRGVRTVEMMDDYVRAYYPDCAAGGCTLCGYLKLFHYSFAKERLYWWTGSPPEFAEKGQGI